MINESVAILPSTSHHFERNHRGTVYYGESNPGNENRRPVLCPPLPRLRAVELDSGLRNLWQEHQDCTILMCFGMPEMDISIRCGQRKGYKNVMYCICVYRWCLYGMYASQNQGPCKNLCTTAHHVL